MNLILTGGTPLPGGSGTLPQCLQKFKIAGAQYRYIVFSQGEILSQSLEGQGFSILIHHLFLKEPVSMVPNVTTESVVLHYQVIGDILFSHKEIREGEYTSYLINSSKDFYFKLVPGHYHIFQLLWFDQKLPAGQPRNYSITPEVSSIICGIIKNEKQGLEKILYLEARVRDLYRLFLQDQATAEKRRELPHPYLRILRSVEYYIETNLDHDLTVKKLASRFGVSRSWLQELCSIHYKKGIHQLVKEKRMEEASRLLLTGNDPVSTIVLKVSDMTFSSFSAAFKKYSGSTPLAYRKLKGQNIKK